MPEKRAGPLCRRGNIAPSGTDEYLQEILQLLKLKSLFTPQRWYKGCMHMKHHIIANNHSLVFFKSFLFN